MIVRLFQLLIVAVIPRLSCGSAIRSVMFLLCSLILSSHVASAQSAAWTSHTSMRQMRALAVSETHVWSATTGGVFSYAVSSGEIRKYTVVEGLHAVDVKSIGIDSAREVVWLGYGDGVINRLHPSSGEIEIFRDIERATQFSARGINRIVVRGDSLLVATEFGVVIFDPVKSEVRDSYTRLGSNPPATEVFDIAVGPDDAGLANFWIGTMDGIARSPVQSLNLQDPSAWTLEKSGFQSGQREVRSLSFFRGVLYAGTEADVYSRDVGGIYQPLSLTNRPVTDLQVVGDQLLGVERFILLGIDQTGQRWTFGLTDIQDPVGIGGNPVAGIWVGDAVQGLTNIPLPPSGVTPLEPNFSVIPSGPYDGFFSDLDVDADGNVWVGGVSGPRTGFYHLSAEREWTTYSTVFYPELQDRNRFTRVHVDASGNGWAGSEGSALARATLAGDVSTFDQSNSSLLPATGTDDFVIVGGIDSDAAGNLWVTTRGSVSPLHVLESGGSWTGFGPLIGDGLSSRATAYGRIYVDSFDQKWILIRDENNFQRNKGLAVVDTGNPSTASDDVFRFFGAEGSAGQGLPSIAVLSVAEDRDGLVWIGTESGPAYFVNTGIIASDQSARAIWPQWADRSDGTFMLFGLRINDVAVDPANQIWFATNSGAYLVRAVEGGYQRVHHFTSENSPLFSDEVLSVAVDGKSGEVFFSTSLGLISFSGDALRPALSADDLFVYPNPAKLDGMTTPQIFIEGLVEETDIRILTATGSLVRKIEARGGRATWDGRDESGRIVDSGVYLIVAVGTEGAGTAHGKVAVIN